MSVEEAVRRMTSLPASNLGIERRGLLHEGYFADVVVFNPGTIQDYASFVRKPFQLNKMVELIATILETTKPTPRP